MKLGLALCMLPLAASFAPTANKVKTTELFALSRRQFIPACSALIFGAKAASAGTANPFMVEEINFEPSQLARPDKVDINGAFVVSRKQKLKL